MLDHEPIREVTLRDWVGTSYSLNSLKGVILETI